MKQEHLMVPEHVLSGIAGDVNGEVAVILDCAEKLLKQAAGEDKAVRAIAERIKVSGSEIGRLVKGMRLLYKMQDDGMKCPVEPGQKCLRVLVVDDEFALRSLLKDMLESCGHTVTVAEDGEVGVVIFREAHHRGEAFDVVVTDFEMPRRSGLELARVVKELVPSTPVVLFSGSYFNLGDSGDPLPFVDCCLAKPGGLSNLPQTVAALASRNPASNGPSGKGATGSFGGANK